MPAEWEPHSATWMSWPHNLQTWPGVLDAVERAMVAMVVALGESERVHVNVLGEAHERHVRGLLGGQAPRSRLAFHHVPTDDAWCRDYGAILLVDSHGKSMALDFGFNAWGGKYRPWDRDAAVGATMAAILGIRRFDPGMVLEGGSVDVNGAGALLTTGQCLLNPNRNPGLDRAQIQARLQHALGVRQVIWLEGGIRGDDTDGHVDAVARFVSANRVAAAVEPNERDPNYRPLLANRARLERVRLSGGQSLEVVGIPMPEPVRWRDRRLPASYLNFYVANDLVLVPRFGCRRDGEAQEILGECFPGRRIVPIDCRQIVIGLGAVHCLTQQVPALRYTRGTGA